MGNNYFPARAYTFITNEIPSNLSSTGQGRQTIGYDRISTFAGIGATEASKFELPYSYDTAARNIWFLPTRSNEQMNALCLHYYAGDAGVVVSRAAADDFQFGYMIGAPVTLVKGVSSKEQTLVPEPSSSRMLNIDTPPKPNNGKPSEQH